VIAGDVGGAGKDIDHQYFGTNGYGTNVFVSDVKKGGPTSFIALSTNGGVVQGDFGTLTIKADGTYDYVLNGDAKVRELLRDEIKTEVFVYKVKDAGGNESETTLSIEVKGVNDQSKITLADASILNVNSSADGLNGGQNSLKIEDPDAGQATFLGVSTQTASSYQGEYGKLTLTPTSTNESFKGYSWVYLKTPGLAASTSDTMRHDLFTFQSKDGTDSVTYDLKLSTGDADNLITKQVFHTSSTTGLKIASTSTLKTDTLVLDGAQLSFDFTTPTPVGATIPNITSIEKVDITGTGNNTIKLSLASLMQADAVAGVHKLFIDGNAGDVVNIANVNIAADTTTVSGYNRYVFDSTHELLIQQALTANFVS
jgi:VCBS repeat-containing protein